MCTANRNVCSHSAPPHAVFPSRVCCPCVRASGVRLFCFVLFFSCVFFYDKAAAVASVALCLAGIFHTAVCAAPPAQRLLRVLALDR